MGSKDVAECCEVVELFLIHYITEVERIISKEDIRTFRNDFLGIVGANRATNERTKKKLIKAFEKFGLEVIIEMNLINTNFLDVTVNMLNGSYKPYIKPNCNARYLHSKSDHRNLILKQIPHGTESRLNSIYNNEINFNSCKDIYQKCTE